MKGEILFDVFASVESVDIPMNFVQMKMLGMVFNAFRSSGFLDCLRVFTNLKQTINQDDLVE